jgi:hypothetical protein
VQEIDNPEVNALKNSYQSALSHYLAGFIYEALGEPSLAAAGYRTAIELRPGIPLLEEALAGLDQRVSQHATGSTDTLFVLETGFVPARYSQSFPLPIPINERVVLVPIAFPVVRAQNPGFAPGALEVDSGGPLSPVQIASVDTMARRALKDEMPGIMLRSAVRATASAVAQYQLQVQASRERAKGNNATSTALDIGSFALGIGSALTASVDEREWRSLPDQIFVARGKLPPGTRTISMQTPAGVRTATVDVSGRYAFVALRFLAGNLVAMSPKAPLGDRPMSAGSPGPVHTTSAPQAQAALGTRLAFARSAEHAGQTAQFQQESMQ